MRFIALSIGKATTKFLFYKEKAQYISLVFPMWLNTNTQTSEKISNATSVFPFRCFCKVFSANILRNKPKIYHKQPVGFHCRQIDRAERQKPKSKPLFGFRTEEKTILLLQYLLLHNPFYGLYPHNIVAGRQTSQIHHRFMTLFFLSDDTLARHIEQLQ